ncbi:MAG: asparagine synthase C-terminal domain-containing protein [Bacteroidales bacterium]
MIHLCHNNGFKWLNRLNIWFKGFIFNGNKLMDEDSVFAELVQINDLKDFKNWLLKSNGCFSIVLKSEKGVFAAVDSIRSLPLFYKLAEGEIFITDNPINEDKFWFDEISVEASIELETAAYVTGNKTLFKNIYQLQAGEFLFFCQNKIVTEFYSGCDAIQITNKDFSSLMNQLQLFLNNSFHRLLISLKGRQAVIPLSGGYDSRLIALMLKKSGHRKIVSFTYGRKGNLELENSKKTADVLNIPWIFIDYNDTLTSGYLNDDTFKKYIHFAGKACSMFYMQDYFAVKYLHDNKLIESDAVFIPGHSGDFIAGSHLRENLSFTKDKTIIKKAVFSATFKQNNYKKHRKLLETSIDNFIINVKGKEYGYQIFEYWDLLERQAKFIVNSASVFDFFGYEFRLPYWDRELVDFFQTVPFEFKLYKKLYNQVLEQEYFMPNQLNFKKEIQASPMQVKKQQLKNLIRPYLPKWLKLKYLVKNDWMAYSIITKPMLEDLENKKIKYKFKADLYNSIISKWYTESFYR